MSHDGCEPSPSLKGPSTKGFLLFPWQLEAVEAWVRGEGGTPYRGTIEVFTGGGKTLIALECFRRACLNAPNARLAIVVPTEALARQWTEFVSRYTTILDFPRFGRHRG